MTSQTRPDEAQRDALDRSEKRGSPQPGSYKDEETAEKVVRIDPIDDGSGAIKGLDPDDTKGPPEQPAR